jgi:hypothetical protein
MLVTPFLWIIVWRALPRTRLAIWSFFWGIGLIGGAAFIHVAAGKGWI